VTVVLDASVTMSWCFEDEASAAGDAIFAQVAESGGIVPSLWHYEVANVLALATRRERISEASSKRFLSTLDRLALEVVEAPPIRLVDLAVRFGLTAYDAAYLDAAMVRAAPLATRDAALRSAAAAAGIALPLEE
jgi:predicted nucleic acid-binding protein